MARTTSQFPELGQEDERTTLATLEPGQQKRPSATPVTAISSVPSRAAQKSAKPVGNAGVRNSDLLYLPKLINIDPTTYPSYQPSDIEEKARGYSPEIAVYNLAPSVLQERLGRFLPDPISNSSDNVPRLDKKNEAAILQQRCHGLLLYIDSLKKEAKVTGETEFSERVLTLSWSVWEKLKNLFEARGQCLEVPDACPGSRDNFMYTWSKAEHYLECEIFGTGEIEFFYRNRKNGSVWGEDTTLEQGFSKEIFDKASLFIK